MRYASLVRKVLDTHTEWFIDIHIIQRASIDSIHQVPNYEILHMASSACDTSLSISPPCEIGPQCAHGKSLHIRPFDTSSDGEGETKSSCYRPYRPLRTLLHPARLTMLVLISCNLQTSLDVTWAMGRSLVGRLLECFMFIHFAIRLAIRSVIRFFIPLCSLLLVFSIHP